MFKKIWTGVCWLAEHLLALVALVTGLAAAAIFGPIFLLCIAALAFVAALKAFIPAGIVYGLLYLMGVPEYIIEPISKVVWGLCALGGFAALLGGSVADWGASGSANETPAKDLDYWNHQQGDDLLKIGDYKPKVRRGILGDPS